MSNDIISFNESNYRVDDGEIKEQHVFIPIGYLNLLGAIFEDNSNYRIFALNDIVYKLFLFQAKQL